MQEEEEMPVLQGLCPALSANSLFLKDELTQGYQSKMGKSIKECRQKDPIEAAVYINRALLIFLQLIMAAELVVLLVRGEWLSAFLVFMIMAITVSPTLFKERLSVKIPAEFTILVIIFVFASLFLGEIQGFYLKFWWWDKVLHISSGLLLGTFGFLLVYVLNENSRIHVYLNIRFVALFAFLFAVATGTIWEIFEFGMDRFFGTNMQKMVSGDPLSGLADTMWDLIVDALGAAVISILGWWYMKRPECYFLEAWIQKFIEKNPGLFPFSSQTDKDNNL